MKFKAVKTRQEYELMKDEMSSEIDNFLLKFNTFITSTSPSHWRSTGTLYTNIKNFKNDLQDLTPLTDKQLEQEWVRANVMTDEKRELWNNAKKYNL